jgi:hypothetical protein
MNRKQTPLDVLRHHVTGAIKKGKSEAIIEQRAMSETFTGYLVTGVLYRSHKRFVKHFPPTEAGRRTAMGINLWRGSVWEERFHKRRLIKRVTN